MEREMEQIRIRLEQLAAQMASGFASDLRSITDLRQEHRDRHEENLQRLERIEEKQDRTNGSVIRHEERLDQHDEDFERMLSKVSGGMGEHGRVSFDEDTIRLAALKWYLAIAGGAVAATWWAMQILGFHR